MPASEPIVGFVLPAVVGAFIGIMGLTGVERLRLPVVQRPMLAEVVASVVGPLSIVAFYGGRFFRPSRPSTWFAVVGAALFLVGIDLMLRLLTGARTPAAPVERDA